MRNAVSWLKDISSSSNCDQIAHFASSSYVRRRCSPQLQPDGQHAHADRDQRRRHEPGRARLPAAAGGHGAAAASATRAPDAAEVPTAAAAAAGAAAGRAQPAGDQRAGPGAAHHGHVGRRSAAGAEADARRALVSAHSQHARRLGRQDYRHVARDRQCRALAHVGLARVAQGQSGRGRRRPPGSPGQANRHSASDRAIKPNASFTHTHTHLLH